ncbi:DivIVA domain-containing protein [Algoriphagus namhaensis]
MKLTPTAIRQQSFETAFRGFEKKDVTQFLEEVAEVVDQLHRENMELKNKLQHTEMEAKRLKDVEESLFRTLKTAEDTGASIIEEANEAAYQIIAEANQLAEQTTSKANAIYESALGKAQSQADQLISAAEKKAQDTIIELRDNMGDLVRSYEGLVEQREALVKSLRRITQDSLNQIDLSEAHFSRLDAKAYKRAVEDLSRSNAFTFANLDKLVPAAGEVSDLQQEEENDFAEEEVLVSQNDIQEEVSLEISQDEIEEHTESLEEELEEEIAENTAEQEEVAEEEAISENTSEVEEIQEEELGEKEPQKPAPRPVHAAPKDEETKKQDSDPSSSFFDSL